MDFKDLEFLVWRCFGGNKLHRNKCSLHKNHLKAHWSRRGNTPLLVRIKPSPDRILNCQRNPIPLYKWTLRQEVSGMRTYLWKLKLSIKAHCRLVHHHQNKGLMAYKRQVQEWESSENPTSPLQSDFKGDAHSGVYRKVFLWKLKLQNKRSQHAAGLCVARCEPLILVRGEPNPETLLCAPRMFQFPFANGLGWLAPRVVTGRCCCVGWSVRVPGYREEDAGEELDHAHNGQDVGAHLLVVVEEAWALLAVAGVLPQDAALVDEPAEEDRGGDRAWSRRQDL